MKTSQRLFAAVVAALFIAGAAYAGDPSGTWKWSVPGRDGTPREQTLKLELKDGKLTGAMAGRQGETQISEATFKDDMVIFKVVREFNENRFETKYNGKLDGDTIIGTVEMNRRGEPMTIEWKATRQK